MQGPVWVSVTDAEAQEGADAAVVFAVTLSQAASGDVTVGRATVGDSPRFVKRGAHESARSKTPEPCEWYRGEDYTATSGTLLCARGESSRVRAMLDGSRTFASGAALTPKLELGVRHDAGDEETGTGLEVGAGLGYADPSRGLDMALRAHGLAVHAEDGYDEWGVSGQLRLVPGGAGRGLSMSLTPSYGVDPAGSERLWAMPASSGLAANGETEPSSRFDAEVGYGMALWGDRFTGTPNVGFGLYAWADPFVEDGPLSPFWRMVSILPAAVEAGATPLVGAGLPPGMTVEGLRFLDGSLVLKLEGGAGAVQLRRGARVRPGRRRGRAARPPVGPRGLRPPAGGGLRTRGRQCPSPGRGSGDKELLIAVAGLAARKSHRRIALEVYGAASVPEKDLYADSDVRGQVRRLVEKARFLKAGGYLELAAGRRPRL